MSQRDIQPDNTNSHSQIKNRILFWGALIIWALILLWIKPWDSLVEPMSEKPDYYGSKIYLYRGQAISFQLDLTEPYAEKENGKVIKKYGGQSTEINAIELVVENYKGSHTGSFYMDIFDENHKLLSHNEIQKDSLYGDNSALSTGDRRITIRLNQPIDTTTTEKINVRFLAPSLTEEEAVIFRYDVNNYSSHGKSLHNYALLNGNLCIEAEHVYPNYFAIIMLAVFFLTVAVWYLNRYRSTERIAVIVLTGMGLCMMLVMAPESQPDEDYHYNSAFVLSNVIMGREDVYEFDNGYHNLYDIVNQANANSAFVRAMKEIGGTAEQDTTVTNIYGDRVDMLQHPISYLAPALGVTLGRILGLNFIQLHYLGRFFNLALFIILAYWGIRLCPFNKELVLLIAALPMTLHQAVSFSRDVVQNGLALLFVCYVLYLRYPRRKISAREMAALILLLIIMTPIKYVYVTLGLLIFMLPLRGIANKARRHRHIIIVACVLCAAVLLLFGLLSSPTVKGSLYSPIGATYTYNTLLRHPIVFLKLTLATCQNGWFLLRNLIGASLSGLSVDISGNAISCLFVLLLALSIRQRGEPFIKKKDAYWILAAIALGVMSIFASMLGETDYNNNYIRGVQGRYFLPFILPALLLMTRVPIRARFDRRKVFFFYWFLMLDAFFSVMSQIAY